MWSDCTVLLLEKLTDHSEVLRSQVLRLSQSCSLSCETMQTEDAEEAFHVLDQVLAGSILLKLLDTVVEIESGHVIRMSLSHLNEVDLELLIEFFPNRNVLVLRISEKLKILANSYQGIPLKQVKDELLISEFVKRLCQTLKVALLLHQYLQISNIFNHLV